LREGYEAIGRRVDDKVRTLLGTIPKAPLEIRAVPPFLEQSQAGGSYHQGSADGSRPGVFYYNTYDLPSRASSPAWRRCTCTKAHRGITSRFQSGAGKRPHCPNFQRFGGNNGLCRRLGALC
jgi:uncharacterized protein (DUF885 family)